MILCFNNGKQIANMQQIQSPETGRSQVKCKKTFLGKRQRHKSGTRNTIAREHKARHRQIHNTELIIHNKLVE